MSDQAGTPKSEKPEILLSVDPETATFFDTGGKTEHMLVNLGDSKLAVKARCSDNKIFRVNPVYLLLDAGQCYNLYITRFPHPPKPDKIVLHYLTCPETETDAKEFFKNNPNLKPVAIKLPVAFASNDDIPPIGPKREK